MRSGGGAQSQEHLTSDLTCAAETEGTVMGRIWESSRKQMSNGSEHGFMAKLEDFTRGSASSVELGDKAKRNVVDAAGWFRKGFSE